MVALGSLTLVSADSMTISIFLLSLAAFASSAYSKA